MLPGSCNGPNLNEPEASGLITIVPMSVGNAKMCVSCEPGGVSASIWVATQAGARVGAGAVIRPGGSIGREVVPPAHRPGIAARSLHRNRHIEHRLAQAVVLACSAPRHAGTGLHRQASIIGPAEAYASADRRRWHAKPPSSAGCCRALPLPRLLRNTTRTTAAANAAAGQTFLRIARSTSASSCQAGGSRAEQTLPLSGPHDTTFRPNRGPLSRPVIPSDQEYVVILSEGRPPRRAAAVEGPVVAFRFVPGHEFTHAANHPPIFREI